MTADYNWKTVLKTGGIICILVLVLHAGLGVRMWYSLVRKCKLWLRVGYVNSVCQCERVCYVCLLLISC